MSSAWSHGHDQAGRRALHVRISRIAREKPPDAATRLCPMPWNWLNDEGASQAEVSGLRIQDLLKKFVPAEKATVVDPTR